MTEQNFSYAVWIPYWYETDQSIAVGETDRFWFYDQLPKLMENRSNIDLAFFNHMDPDAKGEQRMATVVEIYHPQMGLLANVKTDGLDYLFKPIDGAAVIVNAEEEPGVSYDGLAIDDWSVLVTLADVSEPIDDTV